MGFRLFRRVKILPGVSLNLSKSGGSLSFGGRGARVTVGPRGIRKTAGIPGTGISYSTTSTFTGKRASGATIGRVSEPTPEEKLDLGFFKKLFTPANEKALIEGLKCLVSGNAESALGHLKNASDLADGAYLAGVLSLKLNHFHDAVTYLRDTLSKKSLLGAHINKYGVSATISLPITEEISAYIGPDERGVRLALAEAHQALEQWDQAINNTRVLLTEAPDDVVIRLSLAELLFEAHSDDKDAMNEIVKFTESVSNKSNLHATLLLYKARALRKLSLSNAAKDCLKEALSKKKDRSPDVLKAARYERAMVYEETGKKVLARKEFEILYTEDSDYEDVAERLATGRFLNE